MVERSRFFPLSFFLFCACITGAVLFACEIWDLRSKMRKLEMDNAALEEKIKAIEESR